MDRKTPDPDWVTLNAELAHQVNAQAERDLALPAWFWPVALIVFLLTIAASAVWPMGVATAAAVLPARGLAYRRAAEAAAVQTPAPQAGHASSELLADPTPTAERLAYVQGWQWGCVCGATVGVLLGSVLVLGAILLGLHTVDTPQPLRKALHHQVDQSSSAAEVAGRVTRLHSHSTNHHVAHAGEASRPGRRGSGEPVVDRLHVAIPDADQQLLSLASGVAKGGLPGGGIHRHLHPGGDGDHDAERNGHGRQLSHRSHAGERGGRDLNELQQRVEVAPQLLVQFSVVHGEVHVGHGPIQRSSAIAYLPGGGGWLIDGVGGFHWEIPFCRFGGCDGGAGSGAGGGGLGGCQFFRSGSGGAMAEPRLRAGIALLNVGHVPRPTKVERSA